MLMTLFRHAALPPTLQFFHLFYFIVFKPLPFATTVILSITVKVTINDAGGCWHGKFIALTSPKLQQIFIYRPTTHERNI